MDWKRYNVRVYGLLTNTQNEILLSKEHRFGMKMVKFPGGGHELGEGLIDTLKREFQEELGVEVRVKEHFYTTDFLQTSAFNEEDQLISIYYKVETEEMVTIINGMSAKDVEEGAEHVFLWKNIAELKLEEVTFPIDQLVVKKLKQLSS